jgi:hypothetical protein
MGVRETLLWVATSNFFCEQLDLPVSTDDARNVHLVYAHFLKDFGTYLALVIHPKLDFGFSHSQDVELGLDVE